MNTAMSLDDMEMLAVPVLTPSMPEYRDLGRLRWSQINDFLCCRGGPPEGGPTQIRNYFFPPPHYGRGVPDPLGGFTNPLTSNFVYAKALPSPELHTLSTAADVFHLSEGVFAISVKLFHEEDVDVEYAEALGHYVAYNAATRLLSTYPEVCWDIPFLTPTLSCFNLCGSSTCSAFFIHCIGDCTSRL